jgi:uncharacterized membrane protein
MHIFVQGMPETGTLADPATTSSVSKFVFVFIGDGMSYPPVQSAAYLGKDAVKCLRAVLSFVLTELLAAASGGMIALSFAAILSVLCTCLFKLHGQVMPHSKSLLYAECLNLTRIFMASVFVGASGSVMDLAEGITSAVQEAVLSGMRIARAAMGAMTTTLLLAYTGSSIALFMAQGTPLYNILNNNQVAAEIINTIAGSFGHAATAPFTALLAGAILPNYLDRCIK